MIERVAIIGAGGGAGDLGSRLAFASARAGFATALEDVLPANLRRARATLAQQPDSESLAGLVRYATSVEDAVRDADLVIDCVPDELESKLEIFSLLDRMAPPQAIFATPTAALSIADLASCTYRPDRCVSLGFAAGTLPGPLLLTYPPQASPAVLGELSAFWRRVGCAVTLQEDLVALP